jgi:hypothetical protein
MAEGLVDGTAFAVDASLIAADANKQRSTAGTRSRDRPVHGNALAGCDLNPRSVAWSTGYA